MRCTESVVGLILAASMLSGVLAEEWTLVGPRAMGMGGAGVAVTRGGLSSYWNPAGLAPPGTPRVDTFWDVEIPVSVTYAASEEAFSKVDSVVRDLDELDIEDIEQRLSSGGGTLTEDELQTITRLLTKDVPALGDPGTGLVSSANVGLTARIWQFGLSAMVFGYAGGVTKVDLANLALGAGGLDAAIGPGADRTGSLSPAGQSLADALAAAGLATQNQAEEIIFQAERAGLNAADPSFQANLRDILAATQANDGGSVDRFFTQNQSGVDLRGILLQDYALSFAYPFLDLFSVGVNAKLLYGTTYFQPFTLSDIDNLDDLYEDLLDSKFTEDTLNFGIDVGVLVQPLSWLSLGITGRNLNRPHFDFDGSGDYVIDPQARAGIGLTPLNGLTLAADIDLFENHSQALPGYDSLVVGGGVEYALFDVLFLRAGVSKNLAESDEDLLVHFGLGLRIWKIELDVASCLTPDFTSLESDEGDGAEIPERAGLSLMLGVNIPLE